MNSLPIRSISGNMSGTIARFTSSVVHFQRSAPPRTTR
jgi:hypothetical protein